MGQLGQQLLQRKKLDLLCEKLELNASRLVCKLQSNALTTELKDQGVHKMYMPDFGLVCCLVFTFSFSFTFQMGVYRVYIF